MNARRRRSVLRLSRLVLLRFAQARRKALISRAVFAYVTGIPVNRLSAHFPLRLCALGVLLAAFLMSMSVESWAANERSSTQTSASSMGETQAERYPFLVAPTFDPRQWAGEEFHYSIVMMGGEAARAMLTIEHPIQDANLGEVVPVQGLAQRVGLLSALVRFKYGGLSYLNAETGVPVWGEKLLEDSGRVRTYTTFYDRERYTGEVTRLEDGRNTRTQRLIPRHTDEAFSWILRMRSSDLEVGDVYAFYIFDGWMTRRLRLRVVGHVDRYEDVAQRKVTRAAEIEIISDSLSEHPALPWAEGDADLPPIFTVRRSDALGTAWVSLDDRRIPLGIELRTPIGFMRIMLTRHVPPDP